MDSSENASCQEFYVLAGEQVRKVGKAAHEAFWSRDDPGRVALDFAGEIEISTVFLPSPASDPHDSQLSHFETSLFGPAGFIGVAGRYQTWADAMAGHRAIHCELRRSRPH